MNYIAQIKSFWRLHEKHSLNSTDIALYFYLLEVCSSTGWINPFKRNNAKAIADTRIPGVTFFRSRSKLKKAGILNFRSIKGTANVTYKLTNLEPACRQRNEAVTGNEDAGSEPGTDTGFAAGNAALNKNSKLKRAITISCDQAFAFYVETCNNRLLKERLGLDNNGMHDFFKAFYDSKIDLGDLNNKTIEEIARNFYYWLPKHLAAGQKDEMIESRKLLFLI